MNIFKSHFWYHKSQRNGVFLLAILIFILQVIIVFVDFSPKEKVAANSAETIAFYKQIDSLKKIEIANRRPKIFPFNPNYITDYKGAQLGMSLNEIDRLFTFRKTGKFVNSKDEFQQVTKISDSLLDKISPYFKFPDWIVKQHDNKYVSSTRIEKFYKSKPKHTISTTDINKATTEDLKAIYGIGEKLSERIIKYRSKLQGFSFENQIFEVWGLEKETAKKVIATFKILEKPIIKKDNINTITFKELLKNPYIDYELCKKIFEYRDEVAELQNISELKNIKSFPLDKYDRIVLYLVAE
ncbi:helix-hairpin-helix domain-containing protein [uncultured Polaribacter sp.]|uniref:helix-hairpin-helix domain-containing protein n=1 Tax=uncultured Polaribacter sp. TaxID=174711 RepID=UPI00260FAA45|nr:helix-hairpin-helix domain-containing protein [uncultured Polaribacter sp.]